MEYSLDIYSSKHYVLTCSHGNTASSFPSLAISVVPSRFSLDDDLQKSMFYGKSLNEWMSGMTPLCTAIESNNLLAVELFFDPAQDTFWKRPFFSNRDELEIHESCADPKYKDRMNALSPVHLAARAPSTEFLEFFLAQTVSINSCRMAEALHVNRAREHKGEVKLPLVEVIDLDCAVHKKPTPLHEAVAAQSPEHVKLLLEAKCDFRAMANCHISETRHKLEPGYVSNPHYQTPVHLAFQLALRPFHQPRMFKIVDEFLKNYGLQQDVGLERVEEASAKVKASSLLQLAIVAEDIPLIKRLSRIRRDWEAVDSLGENALHTALNRISTSPTQEEIVKILLEHGPVKCFIVPYTTRGAGFHATFHDLTRNLKLLALILEKVTSEQIKEIEQVATSKGSFSLMHHVFLQRDQVGFEESGVVTRLIELHPQYLKRGDLEYQLRPRLKNKPVESKLDGSEADSSVTVAESSIPSKPATTSLVSVGSSASIGTPSPPHDEAKRLDATSAPEEPLESSVARGSPAPMPDEAKRLAAAPAPEEPQPDPVVNINNPPREPINNSYLWWALFAGCAVSLSIVGVLLDNHASLIEIVAYPILSFLVTAGSVGFAKYSWDNGMPGFKDCYLIQSVQPSLSPDAILYRQYLAEVVVVEPGSRDSASNVGRSEPDVGQSERSEV